MPLNYKQSFSTNKQSFSASQKGFAQIFVLVLLLAGIALGVYLVQTKTNLFPKAVEDGRVEIVDKNGNPLTSTSDPNVYLKLTIPNGWQLPSTPLNKNLVGEVYAQSCPQSGEGTTDTFGQPTYNKCIDNSGGSNDPNNNTLCTNGATKYRCFWSGAPTICISGQNENDFNYDCPTITSSSCPINSGCCYQPLQTCSQNSDCPTGYRWCYVGYCINQDYNPNSNNCVTSTPKPKGGSDYKTCILTANPSSGKAPLEVTFSVSSLDLANRPGDSKIRINFGDGSPEGPGYFNISGVATYTYGKAGDHNVEFRATSDQDPNYNYRCTTKVSVIPVLGSIDITNYDEDQSSGGLDPLHIETNLGLYTTTLIPWRLNSLNPDQDSAKRTVEVTFATNWGSFKQAIASVTLNRSTTIPNKNEFLVDIFVDQGLSNQEEIAQSAKDTVNNYINDRFAGAGITKRLKVNQVFMDNNYLGNCPKGSERKIKDDVRCISTDGKIRVWIFNPKDAYFHEGGRAFPDEGRILMTIPSYLGIDNNFFSNLDKRVLTHEMGHIFNLPDYYLEDVDPNFNYVVDRKTNQPVHIGVTSYIKDVMWNNLTYSEFSLISPIYTNLINKIPVNTYLDLEKQPIQYIPAQIVLKILDPVTKSPLPDVEVEVFSQTWDRTNKRFIIPNTNPLIAGPNQNGEINLGSPSNIINRNGLGYSALLRINRGNSSRYTIITRSYLNYLYYQGQVNIATISIPFSSLVEYKPGTLQILSKPGEPGLTKSELSSQEKEILDKHIREHLEESGLIPQ